MDADAIGCRTVHEITMRFHTYRENIMAIAVALILLLLLAGGLGFLMYLAFRRRPTGSPKKFRARGRGPDAHTVMVAFGDSITHATLSADWVGTLRDRLGPDGYAFVNAGLNGHTSADLLRRLDEVVACHPDAVTIMVGTNDVRNGVPLAQFRANLETITSRLLARTTARIALLSATPLGENLTGQANRTLADYNAVVKQTAERTGVDYLPVHEGIAEHFGPGATASQFAFGFGLAFRVAVRHYLFRRSLDDITRGNGLTMLTDHLHLSDRAGMVVADLVANWLCRVPAPTR
ncbi:SGNH/GDSL hydrolase family protein [Streptosporangium sp. CA-135522]|uniref:SGNH/GDSL hydrolase family protein n=1 Tax=Streptosporangium sp. CA-135522 TaxID=3240072 RepID=UPI003D928F44